MKKIIVFMVLVALSVAVQAKVKEKDIVGKWNYTVDTGSEEYKGIFNFELKEKKLAGEIRTEDGTVIPFTKIELAESNVLKLECKLEYDLIKIDLKIEGDKFSGTGSSYEGEAPVYGTKVACE